MRFPPTFLALALIACGHTKPGTHVEIVEQDGGHTYVAGAAGPGLNQGLACTAAVSRAVAAIAQKFADENDDLADTIAEAEGVAHGEVFLQGYAKAEAESAAVQDVQFDPGEHVCLATVRWRPPVFVEPAVKKYAEQVKAAELGQAAPSAPKPAPTAQPAPAVQPSAPTAAAPAPGTPVATPAPVAAPPPAPICVSERDKLGKAAGATQRAQDDLDECKRRAGGDETICHRYKLYSDEARAKEASAQTLLDKCKSR